MPRFRLFLFLVTCLAITACNPSEEPQAIGLEPNAVVDAAGNTFSFDNPPVRLLSLAPNLTEIVYSAGAGDRLVAASQADNFPVDVLTLPTFSTFPLDHEQVVDLEPDLLLATLGVNNETDAAALNEVGIPTFFFSFESVSDIPAAIRAIGDLSAVDSEGAASDFELALDSLHQHSEREILPTALVLIDDEGLYAFGRESYASEAVRLAGAKNLTDAFDGSAAVPSVEFVLNEGPDVIILLSDNAAYGAEDLLAKQPAWASVPAIVNSRVHAIHPDLISRPGPRLLAGISQMIDLFHDPAP